ncbi:IS1 family transposase [Serratia fonticola]|uniref:IS1 family transposase n=1 Tax=Serratia fonticola TaxID=47917 RepID=UPI003AB034E0
MDNVALIGIELGKHSFHIHCQDKSGKALLRKKFTRIKLMQFLATCSPSVVVMEACAGAHFMARHISDCGHEAKLISPQFVRPLLAYTIGSRTDTTCRELLALLTPFNIGMVTSNDWGSYNREVPKNKHLTGKIFTQRIERNNLTLRTRIKRLAHRTICFSRSVELHEKVIGAFIEKYMFY